MSKPTDDEVSASKAVASFEENMTKTGGADYVRYLIPDMHGLLRGKMFPLRSVNRSGEQVALCIGTFLPNGFPACIEDQNAVGVGNWLARPVLGPRLLPASKRRQHGAKIAVAICELFETEGDPVDVDIRRMARRQLKKLADNRLCVFSASEFEFRMYKAAKEGEKREPAHATKHMFHTENLDAYEEFLVDLDRRLHDMNIDMYTMHTECGRGQLEIPLCPAWGIDFADNSALFKMLVKDIAFDYNMQASFMTKDLFTEFSNGGHYNHSVWYQPDQKSASSPTANAFHDPNNPNHLSNLGKHWLAGLMHHAPALTALCCPTVNCYRRLYQPWAPGNIDWGFDNRFMAFRVKVGKPENTYIENRLPSSAANPYMVLAATVAAGLDGVTRNLELPEEKVSLGGLPKSLSEALLALEKDEVLKNALGEHLISWFLIMKKVELEDLKDVDVSQQRQEDLDKEKEQYQFFV